MRARIVLASAVMVGFLVPLLAEEGMWLPNRVPRAQIKAQYGFDVTDDWLAHVQQAAVRFNNGGSAAFVSANGLIATNHHVGRDCIGVLSTPTRNLLQNGFLARTAKDELACPGLEINVLVSIEDVTARIAQAVTPEMTPAAANSARLAAIAAVEKASTEATRLRSDVVTLYQGEYHLYRYKKYTDVRLVFAPEESVAFLAVTPTTSSSRVTTWISRSSVRTRTVAPCTQSTSCSSMLVASRKATSCSSRDTLGRHSA